MVVLCIKSVIMCKYNKGDIIKGIITGVEKYGLFIYFNKCKGLIHISEISNKYIIDINSKYQKGNNIIAKVIDYKLETDQYILSIKSINNIRRKRIKKFDYQDYHILNDPNGFNILKDNIDIQINKEYNKLIQRRTKYDKT